MGVVVSPERNRVPGGIGAYLFFDYSAQLWQPGQKSSFPEYILLFTLSRAHTHTTWGGGSRCIASGCEPHGGDNLVRGLERPRRPRAAKSRHDASHQAGHVRVANQPHDADLRLGCASRGNT